MNTVTRLVTLGAIAALSSLSGCIVAPGHGDGDRYRYENGDRIDRDGHRDVRWCDGHHDDEHCR